MKFFTLAFVFLLIFSNKIWACSFCTSAGYLLFVSEMKKKGVDKDGTFVILQNLKKKKYFCTQFESIFESIRQERIRKEMGVGKYSAIDTKESQEKAEPNSKSNNE
jgi:hypothetical protein